MIEPTLTGPARRPALPDFDLHSEDGELVLHADLVQAAGCDFEVGLDGQDLVLSSHDAERGASCHRLHLPFRPLAVRAVALPDGGGLDVHLSLPPR
jgi:hypothetical protein